MIKPMYVKKRISKRPILKHSLIQELNDLIRDKSRMNPLQII